LETDTIKVGGLELSAAGTASLYADANTTAITIGANTSNLTIGCASIRGPDDGTGLVLGHAGDGSPANDGSAPQLVTMTTTQRDFLVAANGMLIYNSTTGTPQVYDGAWSDFPSGGASGEQRQFIYLRDEKADNTAGGTATAATWSTRDLAEVTDTGGDASVTANVVTLAAGTYEVQARAPAFRVGQHKIRWRQLSGDEGVNTVVEGTNASADADLTANHNHAFLSGRFTITSSATFELQHYVTATRATDGFGLAVNGGADTVEVYAEVWLHKIEDGVAGLTLPGSSTDEAIVRWNGTGGDTLQNCGITINDTNVLSIPTAGAINGAAELTLAALGGVLDIDATGIVSINSSAAVINIGNDAVSADVNIATNGVRITTIGSQTGAARLLLRGGTPGIELYSTSGSNIKVGNSSSALRIGDNTTAQRDALTQLNGLAVYNTTTAELEGRVNGSWEPLGLPESAIATDVGFTTTNTAAQVVLTLTEGTDFDGAGTYKIHYEGAGFPQANNESQFMEIYVAGSLVTGALTNITAGGGATAGMEVGFSVTADAAITAGQAVTGRLRSVGGGTVEVFDTVLSVTRVRA
jgi:hypothetical protein